MKPLTEQDLAWLEGRIGTHGITPEDRQRLISDLRAARHDPLISIYEVAIPGGPDDGR